MTKSIFTKIIEGDEPAEVLYNDDNIIIVLSRAPMGIGHSLVIPKRPVERFYDMRADEYNQLMQVSRKFALVLDAVFRQKVVALQLMGLGVNHVHVHLVPINDEADMNHDRATFGPLEPLKPVADKIRSYLADHPLSSIQ